MYKGWIDLPLDDALLAQYYQGDLKVQDYVNLKENEYCLITHKNEPLSNEIWKKKNGKLQKVTYQTIGSDITSSIAKPRNPQQIMEFDLLNDPTTTIKLVTGRWGTGKTWACATAALEQLADNKFDRIIYIRNNIRLKDTEPVGTLPGDLWDKMVQWVGPFIDAAGSDTGTIKDMVEQEQIIIQPLESIRGRNFKNSLVFVDEAENLTVEMLQLIIARAAENTQIWMNGDTRQRDKASFEKSKGIEAMREFLAGESLFGYVHLIKTERSATAALADKLKPYIEEE